MGVRSWLTPAVALALLCGVVSTAALAAGWPAQPHLVVSNQRTGQTYLQIPADEVSRVELSWVHSVEKTPWRENYELSSSGMQLTDVYLKSYGAGAPADIGGTTTLEDGEIHISGLQKELDQVTWVHSHDANHQLTVFLSEEDKPIVIADELPQRTFLRASVERH